jgi:hypothetical protein
MPERERLERVLAPCCEWCGMEFEEPEEEERHGCRWAHEGGLGVEAPMEWDDERKRPFAWGRGELDGIQGGNWQKGKNR